MRDPRRAARVAALALAGLMALALSVVAPQQALADYRAMVVPITSVEGVTGQVGAYCKSGSAHGGVDISADTGDPVYAAYAGTLQRLSNASYGTYIVITHTNGYSTLYAHLSGYAATAPTGTTVTTGQLIGYAGTTGNSTGVHLHFEVRLNGVSQSGINVAFPCGARTVALTPIAWTFPGLPAAPQGAPWDNLAVWKDSTATFNIRAYDGSLLRSVRFGATGDLPAVGHFQDSAYDNLAVYRPSNASFYVRGADGTLLRTVAFGAVGDMPAVGHFEDSPYDNLAVYRPAISTFYIRAQDGTLLRSVRFGSKGDLPAVGHFEDSPYDNLAVYRPSTATLYIRASDGTLLTSVKIGATGDLPALGHFQSSAYDNLATYRRTNGTFYLGLFDGSLLQTPVSFSTSGDWPAVGQFQ